MVFSNCHFKVHRALIRCRKFVSPFTCLMSHRRPQHNPQSAVFKVILSESRSKGANLSVYGKYAPPGAPMRLHASPQIFVEISTTPRTVVVHHASSPSTIFRNEYQIHDRRLLIYRTYWSTCITEPPCAAMHRLPL